MSAPVKLAKSETRLLDKKEIDRIISKYPNRIPILCEKSEKSDIPTLDKKKYLVPHDLTFGQFVHVIRSRLKVPADKAIFVFVNNTIPVNSALLEEVYKNHKDSKGLLNVIYSGENTYG